ncbi:MAG: SH3 domain-containing protein [Pseudomonadota bacterium]
MAVRHTRALRRAALAALGEASLGACGTLDMGGRFAGGPSGEPFAVGSAFEGQLPKQESRALGNAFVRAMERGETGVSYAWRGDAASGEVTPGPRGAGNLRASPTALLGFRPGLFLSQTFETDLGPYVLTRNANVRYGPSTETDVAETLRSGDGVEVVGKVVDEPWLLVAVDGEIRGFVFDELLTPRPGTDATRDGGPTRRPHLCRPFTQRMTLYGRTDEWSGLACDRGRGWVIVRDDADAAGAADDPDAALEEQLERELF